MWIGYWSYSIGVVICGKLSVKVVIDFGLIKPKSRWQLFKNIFK